MCVSVCVRAVSSQQKSSHKAEQTPKKEGGRDPTGSVNSNSFLALRPKLSTRHIAKERREKKMGLPIMQCHLFIWVSTRNSETLILGWANSMLFFSSAPSRHQVATNRPQVAAKPPKSSYSGLLMHPVLLERERAQPNPFVGELPASSRSA